MDIGLQARLDGFVQRLSPSDPDSACLLQLLNQLNRLGFVLQFATHLAFCQKEARVKLYKERFFLLGKFLERRQNKGQQLLVTIVHNRTARDIKHGHPQGQWFNQDTGCSNQVAVFVEAQAFISPVVLDLSPSRALQEIGLRMSRDKIIVFLS